MTVDEKGNVYIAAGQVFVYSPAGELIDTIDIPERPSQLLFGGSDGPHFVHDRTEFLVRRANPLPRPLKRADPKFARATGIYEFQCKGCAVCSRLLFCQLVFRLSLRLLLGHQLKFDQPGNESHEPHLAVNLLGQSTSGSQTRFSVTSVGGHYRCDGHQIRSPFQPPSRNTLWSR